LDQRVIFDRVDPAGCTTIADPKNEQQGNAMSRNRQVFNIILIVLALGAVMYLIGIFSR